MQNYHAVLDVPHNASSAEIEVNYRLLTRVYHPDRFHEAEDKVYAAWKLRELQAAYGALMTTTPAPVAVMAYS